MRHPSLRDEGLRDLPIKPVAHAWADFIVAELIFTLRLAFVVQSVVTVSSSLSQFFGCAISKGVATGGWVIGKISKESLHPDACSGGGGISLGCSNPPGALGIYSAMKGSQTFQLKPDAHGWADLSLLSSSLSQLFGFAMGMRLTIGGCVIGKIS